MRGRLCLLSAAAFVVVWLFLAVGLAVNVLTSPLDHIRHAELATYVLLLPALLIIWLAMQLLRRTAIGFPAALVRTADLVAVAGLFAIVYLSLTGDAFAAEDSGIWAGCLNGIVLASGLVIQGFRVRRQPR